MPERKHFFYRRASLIEEKFLCYLHKNFTSIIKLFYVYCFKITIFWMAETVKHRVCCWWKAMAIKSSDNKYQLYLATNINFFIWQQISTLSDNKSWINLAKKYEIYLTKKINLNLGMAAYKERSAMTKKSQKNCNLIMSTWKVSGTMDFDHF